MKTLISTSALTSVLLAAFLPLAALAEDKTETLPEGGFEGLSINSLMDMEVTSVSKKSEKASEVAAALYVITQDDIRRSGATSIAEMLRGVPGLQVAQTSSHGWAVSARGFNDSFANKLLVLIDGRSVYTPLFSGVYWDVQDTLLDDIERIEVIRGPGATLWGANAVNGVINIITKNSKDTLGGRAEAGAGNEERGFGNLRYGGKIGDNATYRAYVKYFNRDSGTFLSGQDAEDPWHNAQGGFRTDWDISTSDKLTVQGDIYTGRNEDIAVLPSITAPYSTTGERKSSVSGFNLLSRWVRTLSDSAEIAVQAYYDRTKRDIVVLDESHDIFDIDVQHSFNAGERHSIVWGGGYRRVSDDLEDSFLVDFTPEKRSDNLFSTFIQDKIALYAKELFLTLGSKFEHNDYTGFEYQPSAKITWLANDKQTVWASVARAIRTPSRASDDMSLGIRSIPPGILPVLLRQVGNRSTDSEELLAYELGYRIQPRDNMSLDIAGFYNDYDKLLSTSVGAPAVVTTPSVHAVVPGAAGNQNSGETYGIELSGNWEVNDIWSLGANYSWLHTRLNIVGVTSVTSEGNSPEHQVGLRSNLKLPHNVELSNSVQYVDQLKGERVGDYVRFDTRVGWKPMDNLEVNLVGQNLLDSRHAEFSPFVYNNASQVDRSVYASVTWRF